ncbi:PREDICTED: odorant receptor 67c-like [Wasmannia auropunctata]|uniref:odorant receptor 67c-like n=1 Tax=Wasmannia auropunctata TaxID=64793 RepID=UPI0005EF49DB|nr:PREDICTED: odorant receptor 67c-like [Wasmannia auropunctata]
MKERITLKKAIAVVKFSLFVIWFWPLPLSASKHKVLCMRLYQIVCILLTVTVLASMIYATVKNINDLDLFIKSSLGLFPTSHVLGNILCHLIMYRRLQCVTHKVENFCEFMESHEEATVQREYVDKYSNFYGFCMSLFYMSLFGLFAGPIVLDEPLPAPAEFPFDVSHQPLRAITYMHQIVVGLFIAAHLCVNAFMALLLWLASARFKLLTDELRTITNIYDFAKCIEKHQQLLEYAAEVALTVRPFALVTVFFSTVSLIVFGLIFIAEVSLSLKIQCVFLATSALLEVFMYAWPAEHLIHVSTNVGQAAFEMDWYDEAEYLRKNLQMIILRSQKPILVVLPCGLPSLSLRYYASYLSTIFSYFTTMRIMFEEEDSGI